MDINQLFEACDYKKLDEVRHLVESGNVDVNRAGVYDSWDGVIEGASPLFAAAINGNDDIVYYLVEKGADVSARTTTCFIVKYEGASILHAAADASYVCNCGDHPRSCGRHKSRIIHCLVERGADVSAVSTKGYPSWFYARCDVNSTITLIRLGMDLSQRSPNNKTILQYWASSSLPNSQRVVELLVKKGVQLDVLDRNGLTLLALAAIGPGWPIIRESNLPVLEYLLNQNAFSIEEKISALELAGSVFLVQDESKNKFKTIGDRKIGFSLWRRALKLRETHGIVKNADILSTTYTEFTTLADLEEMQKNPVGLRMQCFLVRQRILSRISPSAVLEYQMELFPRFKYQYWQRMRDRRLRPNMAQRNDSTPCQKEISDFLEFSYILLNSEIINLQDHDSWTDIFQIVQIVTISLELLISYGLTDETACPFLQKQNLMKLLYSVVVADRHHPQDLRPDPWITNILVLISVMATLLPKDEEEIVYCLCPFVDRDRKANERQPLHDACDMEDSSFSFPVVRLLLLAGADPNAEDKSGNTPLHLIAEKIRRQSNYNEARTAELLLIFGAKLYAFNREKITPLSLLEEASEKHGKECDWGQYNKVLPLTHLCANVIRPFLIKSRAKELEHNLLRSFIFVH